MVPDTEISTCARWQAGENRHGFLCGSNLFARNPGEHSGAQRRRRELQMASELANSLAHTAQPHTQSAGRLARFLQKILRQALPAVFDLQQDGAVFDLHADMRRWALGMPVNVCQTLLQ